jgi:hypothetical protein
LPLHQRGEQVGQAGNRNAQGLGHVLRHHAGGMGHDESITSSVRSADLTGVVTEGAEAMGVSLCSAGLF